MTVGGPTTLGDFFTAQKPFVSLKEAPKQTWFSLQILDLLDIASKSLLKTSPTASGISVAGTLRVLSCLGLKHAQKSD